MLQRAQIAWLHTDNSDELADSIARQPSPNIASTAFIRRLTKESILANLVSDRASRETALTRARVPILLVACDREHHAHSVHKLTVEGIETLGSGDDHIIQQIRTLDLTALIEEWGKCCYYEKTDSWHFVAPSGKHCRRFLRVADAIQSKDALDRMAFWLRPRIFAADAILLDTWSIAVIALRAMQENHQPKLFDSFRAHPTDERQAMLDVLRGLRQHGEDIRNVLCVVSVLSSGSFAARLRNCAREVAPDWNLDILGIYSFSGAGATEPSLCRLNDDPENVDAAYCSDCKKGSNHVQVDSSLYYIKAAKEGYVSLVADYFRGPRNFLERHAPIEKAFTVHHTATSGRHHAFYIDVERLAQSDAFKERLGEMLQELGDPPDLVLSNSSHGTGLLAESIRKILRLQVDVLPTVRPHGDFPRDVARRLAAAKRIAVVTDTFINVHALNVWNDVLRRKYDHLTAVYWLVGVARPSDRQAWNAAEKALTTNHRWKAILKAVDTLYLPDWDVDRCPWCQEAQLLKRVSGRLGDPPQWMSDRIDALNAERLRDPLFLLAKTMPLLGDHSPVGPKDATPLFVTFSAAGALQELRSHSEPQRRLAPHFPDLRVLNGVKALTNYSEALIRAVLLRVLSRDEWGDHQAVERKQIILNALQHDSDHVLHGEAIIAGHRRVARFSPEELHAHFSLPIEPAVLKVLEDELC